MVYSALATAMLSGSATGGAAVMLAFGLGTLPMLTGLGLMGARVQQAMQKRTCASPAACWCWLSA
jgi:sulfite exporter TauE/SafE